jgi:hypothetical protein
VIHNSAERGNALEISSDNWVMERLKIIHGHIGTKFLKNCIELQMIMEPIFACRLEQASRTGTIFYF